MRRRRSVSAPPFIESIPDLVADITDASRYGDRFRADAVVRIRHHVLEEALREAGRVTEHAEQCEARAAYDLGFSEKLLTFGASMILEAIADRVAQLRSALRRSHRRAPSRFRVAVAPSVVPSEFTDPAPPALAPSVVPSEFADPAPTPAPTVVPTIPAEPELFAAKPTDPGPGTPTSIAMEPLVPVPDVAGPRVSGEIESDRIVAPTDVVEPETVAMVRESGRTAISVEGLVAVPAVRPAHLVPVCLEDTPLRTFFDDLALRIGTVPASASAVFSPARPAPPSALTPPRTPARQVPTNTRPARPPRRIPVQREHRPVRATPAPRKPEIDPAALLADLREDLGAGRIEAVRRSLESLTEHTSVREAVDAAAAVVAVRSGMIDLAATFIDRALHKAAQTHRFEAITATIIADIDRTAPTFSAALLASESGAALARHHPELADHLSDAPEEVDSGSVERVSARPFPGYVCPAFAMATPSESDEAAARVTIGLLSDLLDALGAGVVHQMIARKFPFAARYAGAREVIARLRRSAEVEPVATWAVQLAADRRYDPLVSLAVPPGVSVVVSGWFASIDRLDAGGGRIARSGEKARGPHISLASLERARRSFERFAAHAPASPIGRAPHVICRDTTTFLPKITDADDILRGVVETDRADPARAWATAAGLFVARALAAEVGPGGLDPSVVYLARLIIEDELPQWMRAADGIAAFRASRAAASSDADLDWFFAALVEADRPGAVEAPPSDVLVIAGDASAAARLRDGLLAAGAAAGVLSIHVLGSGRGVVRRNGLSVSLETAIGRSRLIVTDLRSTAISATLRRRKVVFVSDDELERRRLPPAADLAVVGPAQAVHALKRALEHRAGD